MQHLLVRVKERLGISADGVGADKIASDAEVIPTVLYTVTSEHSYKSYKLEVTRDVQGRPI